MIMEAVPPGRAIVIWQMFAEAIRRRLKGQDADPEVAPAGHDAAPKAAGKQPSYPDGAR